MNKEYYVMVDGIPVKLDNIHISKEIDGNDMIISKLADIRNLFDESDMAAEGHGMEDMISDPYAVVCYAESKLKRLIEENKRLKNELYYTELDLNESYERRERGERKI